MLGQSCSAILMEDHASSATRMAVRMEYDLSFMA
jgi:hypothetical protein